MTNLTEREREVIQAIKESDPRTLSVDNIAKKLYLGYGTVKNTLSAIYDKTETRNMAGLILLIMRDEL